MIRRLLDLATGEDARLALFEAALPLIRKPDYPPRCPYLPICFTPMWHHTAPKWLRMPWHAFITLHREADTVLVPTPLWRDEHGSAQQFPAEAYSVHGA